MKRQRLARANARLRAVSTVYAEADNAFAKVADKTSCRAGCTGCCMQLVWASTAEAEYIAKREFRALARALPMLREQERAVDAIASRFVSFDGREADFRMLLARRYYRLQRPCAFLIDGLCSIYASRPIACRSYYVMSEPALCADPSPQKVAILDSPFYRHGQDMIGTELGVDTIEVADLASVVLHVLGEHDSSRPEIQP